MKNELAPLIQGTLDSKHKDDFTLFQKIHDQLAKWKIAELNLQPKPLHIKEVMERWEASKNELSNEKTLMLPPSHWAEKMGGFRKGEIICLASRPQMGKTSSLLYLINTISKHHNTLFFTPDISERSIIQRMLAMASGITVDQIKSGKLTEDMLRHLYNSTSKIYEMPLLITGDYFLNLQDYTVYIESAILREKIDVVIIDNITSFENQGNEHHPKQVNQLLNEIKKLSQKHKVTFIFTAPVSPALEKEKGLKKPSLHHLQPYGAISQWADKIIFVYRPEYYGYSQDAQGQSTVNKMEWILAKNKIGPTGTFAFDFNRNFGEIREIQHSSFPA